MTRFIGKRALVTGSGRGIGKGIALRLASEGAEVAVHYRNGAESAQAVVEEIRANGGTAFAVQGDVGEISGIQSILAELDGTWGAAESWDILVNNAAMALSITNFDKIDEQEFDRVMAVNFKGPFFLIQEALRRMRPNGRIINISANGSRRAYPDASVYSAAKSALNTLTMLLAGRAGERGITINAVAPGAVVTEMSRKRMARPGAMERYAEQTALGRVAEVEDIAAVVAFLASEDGRWITGETLFATGGLKL